MGTRYQAILKYLDQDYMLADKETKSGDIYAMASKAKGIIIATPTMLHRNCLEVFSEFNVPILCEKPLSKSLDDLIFIRDQLVRANKMNLTMTMQYELMTYPGSRGDSWYDYFRHGNDGMAWDCLQIIGLAKGKIELRESSPMWDCGINGQRLDLSDMDRAYVRFVKRWLGAPGDDINRLFDIHLKVMEFQDG